MLVEAASGPLAARVMESPPMAKRLTLRQARLRAALSLNELARAAGVSSAAVSDIEHGDATPRMVTIRKLAGVLGVAPQDIAWPGDPLEVGENDAPSGAS